MIIDNGLPEGEENKTEGKEEKDAPENASPETSENEESVGTENADTDGRAEGEPAEEGAEQSGSEDQEKEPQTVVQLQSQIQALTDQIKELTGKKEEPKDTGVKEMKPEEWEALEQKVGVNKEAIRYFTNQSVKVFNKVMEEIDKRFGKFEKNDAITALSKDPKFSDASQLRDDVEKFLEDFDSRHHSNPELLKKAVVYARGLNMDKKINQARNSSERNKHITGAGRPTGAGGGKGTKPITLSPIQKQAAELMGGEEVYKEAIKLRGKAFDE